MKEYDLEDDFDMDDPYFDTDASELIAISFKNAMEVTQLVVENRVRNSQKMTDQDIYDIYAQSVKNLLNTSNFME